MPRPRPTAEGMVLVKQLLAMLEEIRALDPGAAEQIEKRVTARYELLRKRQARRRAARGN